MNWKRYLQRGISLALILLAGWLFLGIYRDREFDESYLFLKHRPTFKLKFHAPLGESDRTLQELEAEQRVEEMLFQAYVEQGGGNRRCLRLSIW